MLSIQSIGSLGKVCLKSCPAKVGDLISVKHNPDLVGVITEFSLNQGVFWLKWLDSDLITAYSARGFDTMFDIVARA